MRRCHSVGPTRETNNTVEGANSHHDFSDQYTNGKLSRVKDMDAVTDVVKKKTQ